MLHRPGHGSHGRARQAEPVADADDARRTFGRGTAVRRRARRLLDERRRPALRRGERRALPRDIGGAAGPAPEREPDGGPQPQPRAPGAAADAADGPLRGQEEGPHHPGRVSGQDVPRRPRPGILRACGQRAGIQRRRLSRQREGLLPRPEQGPLRARLRRRRARHRQPRLCLLRTAGHQRRRRPPLGDGRRGLPAGGRRGHQLCRLRLGRRRLLRAGLRPLRRTGPERQLRRQHHLAPRI